MTALIIIVVVIFAIMMITVGVDAEYVEGQLSLSAVLCGIKIKILPKKEKDPDAPVKEPKPKKVKKQKPIKKNKEPDEEKAEKKKKLNFSFEEIISLLNKVITSIGRFNRKIRVGRFMLHYTGGGDDPYKTAMTYGYLNAGIAALAPACRKSFLCHNYDILTKVDFSAEKTLVDFGIRISLRIGSVFALINSILFGALEILIKNKFRLAREKRDKNNKAEISNEELNQIA